MLSGIGSNFRMSAVRTLISLALSGAFALAVHVAYAVDFSEMVSFDIPPQSLSSALVQFADQAGVQLTAPGTSLHGMRTDGVQGKYKRTIALTLILRHTGFTYRVVDEGTIAITRPSEGDRAAGSAASTSAPEGSAGKISASNRLPPPEMDPSAPVSSTDHRLGSVSAENQLEEVIVTAQKRRQRVFDVPIDLVVLGSQELNRRHIDNVTDLQYAVPGLFVEGDGARRQITINGVSNVWGNGALVGIYIDDADATSEGYTAANGYGQFDTQTYDLSRVEVLRGPQGTLYGEGSMGGTIRFITNEPVLDRFQMNSDVDALFTQYGAPSQHIEAMVNTPLISQVLGLRFAGVVDHDGGWIDQPAANLKNINSQDLVDARVEALWEPTARFKLNLMQMIHRDSSGIDCCESPIGIFTQSFGLTLAPTAKENSNLSNLRMTYDVGGAQLLSSTTYFRHSINDSNYGYPIPYLGVNYDYLISQFPIDDENLSQELRFSRMRASSWQWTVGMFYKDYKDSYVADTYFGPPGPLLPSYFGASQATTSSKSWSAFGDTSYSIMNRLTLGVGVRYFRDKEGAGPSPVEEATFISTDPRFYLRYLVTPRMNVYASAAKGFRSGGFNSPPYAPYQPENLWTYDLGTKIRLLRQLKTDVDIFVSNYSDFVIPGFSPSDLNIENNYNAGTARIKGIDAEIDWLPADQWDLSIRGDYLDAKFVTIDVLESGYEAGERLPVVSKYSIAASLQREFRWRDKPGYAKVDFSDIGPQEFRYYGGPLGTSDNIHLLGATVGLQWSGKLGFRAYVQNLLNDRGWLDAYSNTLDSPRLRPRTFGAGFALSVQ